MILVTGGTGLVGAHLLYDLAQTHNNIRAIYRVNSNLIAVKNVFSYYCTQEKAEELFNSIEWIEADITDVPTLDEAFKGVTHVYHSAALVSFVIGHDAALRNTNIQGTANIVNLCIANSIQKLCYVSSIASLGKTNKKKFVDEETNWNPEEYHSDYAISKYGAEIEVWRGTQEGLNAIILNPGVIIGPGFWEMGSGLIFKKIDKGLKYYFPKVTGFVGVWDVVKAMIAVMNSPIKNEQFILVSENKSFKEVLELTAENLDRPKPSKKLKKWMVITGWIIQTFAGIFGYKRRLNKHSSTSLFEDTYYSNEKLIRELKFRFSSVKEAIEKTAEFYPK